MDSRTTASRISSLARRILTLSVEFNDMNKPGIVPIFLALSLHLASGMRASAEREFSEAPESLRALFNELEEILSDKNRPVDIGRLILQMNKVIAPDIRVDELENRLDTLAGGAPWNPAFKAEVNISRLNRYLFSENNYASVESSPAGGRNGEARNSWLGDLILRRSGNCNSLSSLYIVLGQKRNIPIQPIIVPGHMFVRVADGDMGINIETTVGGRSLPDADYKAWHGRDLGEPYMRPLSLREYMGVLLSNQLGYDLANELRDEEAMAAYTMAVRFFPGLPDAWHNKGVLHRQLGQAQEALSCFGKALDIDSHLPQIWNSYGNALLDLHRYEAALVAFDKALDINPDYRKAREGKSMALWAAGRREEALAIDPDVEVFGPSRARDLGQRATTLGDRNRHQEALALYEKALRIAPDHYRLWSNKGNSLAALGRTTEALACYDKALSISPGYSSATRNRALLVQFLQQHGMQPRGEKPDRTQQAPAGDSQRLAPEE